MTSKRKPNGCTSVRRVEEATRKCGCTVNEFFRRAVRNGNVVRDFDIDAAVKAFLGFQKYGPVANSHYGIPSFVIIFAVKVLGGEHPQITSRKEHDRNHTRPSIAARGR